MRRIALLVRLATMSLAVLGAAASAQAAAPGQFTITLTGTGQSPSGGGEGTFVATAPLCPTGTWIDNVQHGAPNSMNNDAHSGRFNLLITKVFTCDDGSGTFFDQDFVLITFPDVTGQSVLQGGTGAYVDFQGKGADSGSFDTNQTTISGFIIQL
jgi:hypothetical protein